MNPDAKIELIKGSPIWIVVFFQTINDSLPVIILWVTAIYGVLQIYKIIKELFYIKKEKEQNEPTTIATNSNRRKSN